MNGECERGAWRQGAVVAAFVLLAGAAWGAPPGDLPGAPAWLPGVLADVERSMASVESGRRLQAAAGDVPVDARDVTDGPPVAFEAGERPTIAVDPRRAEKLTAVEWELALARARARAAKDPGVRLIEAEQAAEQSVLEYALDRDAASPEFRRAMAKAAKRIRARGRVERSDAEIAGGSVDYRDMALPPRDPDLEVELLARFADEPQEFWWAVERQLLRSTDAVRLSELETFLWSYAEKLDRVECPARGRYCELEGRLIRPELVKAARATTAGGGVDRARETLGNFQGEAASRLRERARAWLKKI